METKSNFFATNTGKWVIILINAIIIWGLGALCIFVFEIIEITYILMIICAFFGWKFLVWLDPSTASETTDKIGLILLKFVLAVIAGVFVTPYVIGKMTGKKVQKSIQAKAVK